MYYWLKFGYFWLLVYARIPLILLDRFSNRITFKVMKQTLNKQTELLPMQQKPKGEVFFPHISTIRWNAKERLLLRKLYTPTELKGHGRPPMLSVRIKRAIFEYINGGVAAK